ncbi:hypothetical protein PAAG_11596 [Paracoccidioides lutzii Pb01]|uniref:Uncharacterized protein n=1 Tax=Paracoccidioides lutzii (strain ATCC MYA-826 / Pb01) TaxID=502779 RepID=A0A0A2V699_PARBA|nr:hypothetical protein PAAG_11596 [Paracoccidioides lutzii Pb01]KGQ01615.1 hypothetical protein PAAG_11596 [Paracoccidioides lutzii Pb01]
MASPLKPRPSSIAGSDTTASSMTYLVWTGCRDPAVQEQERLKTSPRPTSRSHTISSANYLPQRRHHQDATVIYRGAGFAAAGGAARRCGVGGSLDTWWDDGVGAGVDDAWGSGGFREA